MNSLCSHIDSNNITFSIHGKSLYKDQCLRCFEDLKSPKGVDLCLKCFSGNCRSEFFNHSQLHYNQKSHPVVLNLKYVLVPEEKNDSQEKSQEKPQITKLAIGKPGGADFSDEKWELWATMRCIACDKEIDYNSNNNLKDLVTSIINSASASEQSSVSAWELEIVPCEHTLTLQQYSNINLASKMTAHCNDCNLSSNLWICLTCGNLSCGRKNYDGTGGNGHALQHFKNTGHPIVVKSGTITPDGEASIYCYACDNDVKDIDLPQHLKNLGIDVNTQKKTEKTMTEMNIEMNINFSLLSKTIEEGQVLIPAYGPGYTGLENLGNSCYMNSVLQVLFSFETFQSYYLDNALDHLNTCTIEPYDCFFCQVSKVIFGMYSGLYSAKKTKTLHNNEIEEFQEGIKPSAFKHFFGKGHQEFSSNKQQDAFEYMNFILEKFERAEKMNNRQSPKRDFEFEIETRLECIACHGVKYKTQPNYYLALSVPNWEQRKTEDSKVSIEECIGKFLGEEEIELNCPQCKINTKYIKTQRILNFPRYLIVIFERFVYDWVPIKLDVQFIPPLQNFDVTILTRPHSKSNEAVLESTNDSEKQNDVEEKEPDFNKDDLNLLQSNGLTENAAKQALYLNGNNPELAIMWYFENMDNPVLNNPVSKIKLNKKGSNAPQVNMEKVNELLSMGFTETQAIGALAKCDNNTERAIDYLFNHPEETFNSNNLNENQSNKIVNLNEYNQNNKPLYDLYAFITHLGKNTSHGHYVCHIKKSQQWIYYNDTRVNISNNPPIHKGYIYFFATKK